MIHSRSELTRSEEMHRIEVGDINSSGIGRSAFTAIFLDVHAEEADVRAVDFFEGEKRFRSVRKFAGHVAAFDEPAAHAGLDLDDLVAGRDHSNRDLARTSLLLL